MSQAIRMFKKSVQAIGRKRKARKQTRKNIKSMAETAARATRVKTRPRSIKAVQSSGVNVVQSKARKAYKRTKKSLESQIPKRYR